MKKIKAIIPTLLAAITVPAAATLICATKLDKNAIKSTEDVNATASLAWSVDSQYNYGEINASSATVEITQATTFGMIPNLPIVTPNAGCHFGGWYDKETDKLYTADTILDPAEKTSFNIVAKFYPTVKTLDLPQTTSASFSAGSFTLNANYSLDPAFVGSGYTPALKWKILSGDCAEIASSADRYVKLNLKSTGKVTIQVLCENGGYKLTDTCEITVEDTSEPVTRIELDKKQLILEPRTSGEVSVTYSTFPTSAQIVQITPKILDPTICSYGLDTANNKVKILTPSGGKYGIGRTLLVITITNKDNTTVCATCEIIVKEKFIPIQNITINNGDGSLKMGEGNKQTLSCTVTGESGKTPTYPDSIVWSSSLPNKVKVSSSGVITAVENTDADTPAIITATAVDDPKAETKVSASISVVVVANEWTINFNCDPKYFAEQPKVESADANTGVIVTYKLQPNQQLKVTSSDVVVHYATGTIAAAVETLPTGYDQITIDPDTFGDSREMTIEIAPHQYYSINTDAQVGVNNITVKDTIVGNNITGSIVFKPNYSKLNIDNCYITLGDSSTRIYGSDAFIYDVAQPAVFAIDKEAIGEALIVNIHLDANTETPWDNVTIQHDQNIIASIEKNTYGEDILVAFDSDAKYQLSYNNTIITIDGYDYHIGDGTGMVTLEKIEGQACICIHAATGGFDKDENILVDVKSEDAIVPYAFSITTGEEGFYPGDPLEAIVSRQYSDISFNIWVANGWTLCDGTDKTHIDVILDDDTVLPVKYKLDDPVAGTIYKSYTCHVQWNYEWGKIKQFTVYIGAEQI